MDLMKQLLHLSSTVNDDDNEEGAFDVNNEGDEESMPSVVLANESANAMNFDTMMKKLQEWRQLGDLRSTQKMVTLAKDGFQVPVVCFDFPTVIICSLFNNPEVKQIKKHNH